MRELPIVLVVDDHPENLLTVEAVLQPLDVRIHKALRADAALQFLLTSDPAVILMDVEMPDMDGFDTARMIRERPRCSETPIIFITAVERGDAAVREGYALGAVDYLVKPFHPDILRWKVSVFVELYKSRHKERLLIEEQMRRAEAEGTARRARLLADIASILAARMDDQLPLSRIAHQCVPDFADSAAIFLYEDDRSLRLDALAGPADAAASITDNVIVGYHPFDPLFGGPGRLAGVATVNIAEGARQGQLSPRHRDLVQQLGVQSGLFVPLRGLGETRGILALYRRAVDGFSAADRSLAADLRDRVVLGISNRELYLESQKSNRAKDEFLAVVSHELRTPLVTIAGWTNLLLTKQLPPDMIQKALKTIQRSAKFQADLVGDILDFSCIATGNFPMTFQDLDLKDLIEQALEAMRPLAEEKKITMIPQLGDTPAPVSADPNRLHQVFSNLISNAIKFTGEGGKVVLALGHSGESVWVQISDTGIGVEPAFLPQMFRPFVQADSGNTRRYGGLGLGLAIVQRLVELHGGDIRVESGGRGQGTLFRVTLPLKMAKTRAG
jgi:signal transduction histidine kinase/DNA-binding response OmpR family regulator